MSSRSSSQACKAKALGHLALSDVSSLISTHLTPTQSSSQNGFQPMNSPSSACPQGSEYLHAGPGPPPPVCLPPTPTQLPFIPQDSAQSISCRSQSSPCPTGVGLVAFLLWNLATVSDHLWTWLPIWTRGTVSFISVSMPNSSDVLNTVLSE